MAIELTSPTARLMVSFCWKFVAAFADEATKLYGFG